MLVFIPKSVSELPARTLSVCHGFVNMQNGLIALTCRHLLDVLVEAFDSQGLVLVQRQPHILIIRLCSEQRPESAVSLYIGYSRCMVQRARSDDGAGCADALVQELVRR